jgi:hypothetical protein
MHGAFSGIARALDQALEDRAIGRTILFALLELEGLFGEGPQLGAEG